MAAWLLRAARHDLAPRDRRCLARAPARLLARRNSPVQEQRASPDAERLAPLQRTGQAATSNIQLQELSPTKKAGDKVQIGYSRDGKESTATVTLGTQPDQSPAGWTRLSTYMGPGIGPRTPRLADP